MFAGILRKFPFTINLVSKLAKLRLQVPKVGILKSIFNMTFSSNVNFNKRIFFRIGQKKASLIIQWCALCKWGDFERVKTTLKELLVSQWIYILSAWTFGICRSSGCKVTRLQLLRVIRPRYNSHPVRSFHELQTSYMSALSSKDPICTELKVLYT